MSSISLNDYQQNLQPLRDNVKNLESLQNLITRTDEDFLLRFLKTAKNNLEKATKRYEEYYKVLSALPNSESVLSGDPEKYKWVIDCMKKMHCGDSQSIHYFGSDSKGRHIIATDTSKFLDVVNDDQMFDASLYLTVLLLDFILESYPDCYEQGLISLEDQAGLDRSAFKVMYNNMSKMKVAGQLMDGTIPVRFNKCFVMNGPAWITAIWKLVKVFLTQKMVDKCDFQSGSQGVIDFLGGEQYLPSIFGGSRQAVAMEFDVEEQLRKAFPRFKEQNSSLEL